MKRIVALGVVASMSLLPAAQAAPAGKSVAQEESGTVLFPTPHPQDPAICFQGVARRINMLSQGTVSGPFGEIFDIDKATWGGKFKLEVPSGATGREDMDLYFFQTFGGTIPEDPILNSPVILHQYQERKPGGEVGTVPPEATKAIACLFDGAAASFEYKADPPKAKKGKKKKKK